MWPLSPFPIPYLCFAAHLPSQLHYSLQQGSELLSYWEFPGGPVVRISYFHCRGFREDPACHTAWPKKKKTHKKPKTQNIKELLLNQSSLTHFLQSLHLRRFLELNQK